MLPGDHAEKGVLVVDSHQFGVRHGDATRQVFVYNAALESVQLGDLAYHLAHTDVLQEMRLTEDAIFTALVTASNKQRQETLKRLAGGYPIFVANDDEVILSGKVPD